MNRRRSNGLLALTLAVVGAASVAAWAWAGRAPIPVALEIGAVVVWAVVGAYATRMRPGVRIGPLIQTAGLVLALELPVEFDMDPSDGVQSSLIVFGQLFNALQFAVVGHAYLAYPRGDLPERVARVLMRTAYGVAAVETPIRLVLAHRAGEACLGGCKSGESPPGAWDLFYAVHDAVWLGLAAAGITIVIGRVSKAGHRQRRVLAYPLVAIAVALLIYGGTLVEKLVRGAPGPSSMEDLLPVLGVAAIPVAFLVGLLRDRIGYRASAQLLSRIDRASPDDLEDTLRTALADPGLRLAYPTSGGLVDQRGHPVPVREIEGQPMLTISADEGGQAVAIIAHDPSMLEEPELLATLRSAVRFAVDNARLLALNRAHLDELRASRRRLVAAAEEERRRLERDLHDGAQQRLLSVGLAVQMLTDHLHDADPTAKELLAEADVEIRAAIDELRQLAAGIHPAVLTDHGLVAAIGLLARRSRLPVSLYGDLPHRPGPDVEAAAYFVVSECLVNAVKHAEATTVTVALVHRPGTVALTICDDGVGGVDPANGSGLRGLADRVAAVEGRLRIDSPPRAGTRIEVEMPCESSSSMTAS